MDKLYNVTKAATYLGVTRWTLYRWHKDGLIRFIKINGTNKVSENEIRRIRQGGELTRIDGVDGPFETDKNYHEDTTDIKEGVEDKENYDN